jgi:hypothetical protein
MDFRSGHFGSCFGCAATAALLVFASGVCADGLDGFWRSDGYGFVFEIAGDKLHTYQVTKISAMPSGSAHRLKEVPPGIEAVFQLELEPFKISVTAGSTADSRYLGGQGAASRMVLRKLVSRPDVLDKKPANTPEANFDVFWQTFAEQYPFFALHGVDWNAIRAKYRDKITDNTKPEELFAVFKEMIKPLHDAHIFLQARDIKKSYQRLRPNPHPLENRGRVTEIIKSRLHGPMDAGCNGKIKFGMLTDKIGYIRIMGFAGYSTKPDFDDWIKALHTTLDQALAGSDRWQGLVVDVRVNGGGSDVLGVEVASRLATKDYLAFTKRARSDPEDPAQFTPPQETRVHMGKEPRFGGKVVLLTGPDSVSAAETFTMALMGRTPAVTRIGENTQGVFSDVLDRTLPNGWRFGLPNEIFLTETGKTFDMVGVPPDIAVPVFPPEDLSKGRDGCLEKALESLVGNPARADEPPSIIGILKRNYRPR